MEYTVFYAWQNDAPSKWNRFFIRNVLEKALNKINRGIEVEDSPRLDYDTKDVAGLPEIVNTILGKINSCGLFIADVTLVGSVKVEGTENEPKLLPNPNVMLELGYAAAKVSWERVICIMNEHYGKAEQQIFDIKNRRFPICYTIDPNNPIEIDEAKTQLALEIESAVKLAASNEYEKVEEVISNLDLDSLKLLREHAQHDVFWRTEDKTMGEVLVHIGLSDAIRHILSLKLIKGTFNQESQAYVYEWTYLGKQTLIQLGLRQRIS